MFQIRYCSVSYLFLMVSTALATYGSLNSAFADDAGSSSTLPTFNVSGRNGADAPNGRDGSPGYYGSSGENGTNAGTAQPGENAGNIQLTLSTGAVPPSQTGVVVITGQIMTSDHATQNINTSFQIGTSGFISAEARGGKGGNGGAGGVGGNGGEGRRGHDASRFFPGENGEPGGNGGNGGNGTPGAQGGSGGSVAFRVKSSETQLLMLVRSNVDGGAGGSSGRNGDSGRGGYGGRGGDSYSWPETRYESRFDPATHRIETFPITEWRHMPGGFDGRSGSSGTSGWGNTSPGAMGSPGEFEIQVQEADGTSSTYRSRYDLSLVDFKRQEGSNDSIYEPGEEVIISKIRVRNNGGMPTPSQSSVQFFLQSHDWIISEGQKIVLDKSLAPGEEIEVPGTLKFKIKDYTVDEPGSRFISSATVQPGAGIESVNREFGNFVDPQNFQITYPVEITPIASELPINLPESLAPGDRAKVLWKVTNISSRDFGGQSEMKRLISTQFKYVRGDLSSDSIVFRDSQGKEISLKNDSFIDQISQLKAGESTVIEGSIELKESAPYYSKATFETSLSLGKIASPGDLSRIQFYTPVLSTAQKYKKSGGSKILLITNSQTTREELLGFQAMANEFGFEVNVWDVSYYGYLDLARQLDKGSNLFQDWKDGTLVFLNYELPSPSQYGKPLEFLGVSQFRRAAREYGINVLVLGKTRDSSGISVFEHLTVPNGDTLESRYISVDSAIQKKYSPLNPVSFETSSNYDEISVDRWKFGGQPNEGSFQKVARKFASRLTYMQPDRRYFVVTDFSPTLVGKAGLERNWHYGTIQVREGLNGGLGSGLALEIDPAVLHSGKFLENPDLVRSFVLSLGFQQKIGLMKRLFGVSETTLGQSDQLRALVASAVMAELGLEQEDLRKNKYREALKEPQISEKLAKLHVFVDSFKLALPSLDSPLAETLLEMDAKLRYLVETQVTLWDRIVDVFSNRRMGPKTTKESLALLSNLESGIFASNLSKDTVTKAIKVKYFQYKMNVKAAIENHKREGTRVNAAEVTLAESKEALTTTSGLTGAFEEYEQTAQRILTKSEFEEWKRNLANP